MGLGTSLAITLGSTLLANKITGDAQERALKKRLALDAESRRRRTAKADQRLGEQFKRVAQQVSPENELNLMKAEDVKNLKTFDDTEQNSEIKIGEGLNIGGDELLELTNLKSDLLKKNVNRNNARKLFNAQYLSPGAVQNQQTNFADALALARSRLADELVGDRIADDLERDAVQPDGTMMALGDAVRIAGQLYSLYNITNPSGNVGSSSTKLPLNAKTEAFFSSSGPGTGARQGFAPSNFGG